jgi:type IV fimbrial biogenesis protein FimT
MNMGIYKNLKAGFTLLELMVTVAIISITATIAIPNLADMLKEYKLRSAARDVVSTLESMKLRAVKEKIDTKIIIDPVQDTYEAFVDSIDDDAPEWDGSETFHTKNLSTDSLDISSTFASPANVFGFNSRGLPATGVGTITITKDATRSKQIIVNMAGNIRVN